MQTNNERVNRRTFLKKSIGASVGLFVTLSGMKLIDAYGKTVEVKRLDGAVRIAGSDMYFDPLNVDTSGKPSISPDHHVVARSWGTWTFTYEVGEMGMVQGGGLKVITPTGYVMWWSKPQHENPDKSGYIQGTVTAKDAEIEVSKWSPEWGSRGFSVKLTKGQLKKGDKITIAWGLSNRTQVQHTALKNIPFRFTTDLDGDGIYQECQYNPSFDVTPDCFDHLRVTAKTDAIIGEPHRIHVAGFDQWHNLTVPNQETFYVTTNDANTKCPEKNPI